MKKSRKNKKGGFDIGLKDIFDVKAKRVKVLGVCAVADTKLLATEISLMYSLLVEQEDGKVEIVEVRSQHIQKYAKYIVW